MKKRESRSLARVLVLFTVALSLVILVLEGLYFSNSLEKAAIENAVSKSSEREAMVVNYVASAEEALIALRGSSFFERYLHQRLDTSDVETLFLALANSNKEIMKIRFIDEAGLEEIRVERKSLEDEPFVVPQNLLQDKSHRYFYQDSTQLDRERVWLSAFDLNMENGSFEIPYKPTFWAALPVIFERSQVGSLIINYFSEPFMNRLFNAPLYDMVLFDDTGHIVKYFESPDNPGDQLSYSNVLDTGYHIKDFYGESYEDLLKEELVVTGSYVATKLKVPIYNGLHMILSLKESYLAQERSKILMEALIILVTVLVASGLLTFMILRIFGQTLFNLNRIRQLNDSMNTASMIAKIGFWDYDPIRNLFNWNSEAYDILGIRGYEEALSLEGLMAHVPEDEIASVLKEFRESIQEGREYCFKHHFLTRDQKIKYVEERAKHYYDKNNHHIKSVGSIYDLTEASESEEKFKTILNFASDGIHILNTKGDLIEYSYSFAHNLGYDLYDVQLFNVSDWDKTLEGEDLEALITSLIEVPRSFETIHTRKDGTTFNAWINARGFELGGEKFLYASQRDISAIKTTEGLLIQKSREQEMLLSLFDLSDAVLFKWSNDNQRTVDYVSSGVVHLLGYTKEDFLSGSVNYMDCIHKEDLGTVLEETRLCREQKSNFVKHKSYRLITKEDEIKWVLDQTVIEVDEQGNIVHFIGYILNITKEKEFELALQDNQQKLLEINQELETSIDNLQRTTTLYETEKEKYQSILNLASDAVFFMDLSGKLVEYSEKTKELLGYTEEEMLSIKVTDWDPEITEALWEVMMDQLKQGPIELERTHVRKDGSSYIAQITAKLVHLGDQIFIYSSVRDISRMKEIQQELEDNRIRWQFAVEGNRDGLWDWNVDTGEVYYSPQWKKMLGYEEHEISNDLVEWETRVHPDDLKEVYKKISTYFAGETESYVSEHRIRCKDGSYIWIRDRGMIIERNEDGSPHRLIGTHTDISDYIRALETIRKQTYTDELTKLYNRKAYNERLQEMMEQYHRYNLTFSLMVLDIDHFKAINDTFGHSKGDEVLIGLSKILSSITRFNDYVFRIGGEEFVILLTGTTLEHAVVLAEKIRMKIQLDFELEGEKAWPVTVSIGVIEVHQEDTMDTIFKRADACLYSAKEAGRNQIMWS